MGSSDVAIIGGGVIGLSIARELGSSGLDVVVLEAAPSLGQGSSSRANGGFRAQFTTAPNIAFSLWSIAAYEELEARTGRLSMHQTGYLLMTGTEHGETSLRTAMDLQRSMGVETQWLAPEQITQLAPFVRADGLLGGTFHSRDGFLDPAAVVSVMAEKARGRGVRIITNAQVRTIERSSDGFVLDHGQSTTAAIVVNAAGAEAGAVGALAGAPVPVNPYRRNLAHVSDPKGHPELTPMCVDTDTGVLLRREATGGWVVAYSNPDDPPSRELTVDPAFFEDLAERVPNRFPFLADLPIDPSHCWAGLYPETPDHHAIVGQAPEVPGFFHCVGFGGHGVMHAPAAGRAIAELITLGRCDTFDLHPLRPSRFDEGDLIVETAVL
jgi:sarcosine oxidase, subunit beta